MEVISCAQNREDVCRRSLFGTQRLKRQIGDGGLRDRGYYSGIERSAGESVMSVSIGRTTAATQSYDNPRVWDGNRASC